MYQLGSKAELLAWVLQPEGEDGPTHITLTTDAAADLVLHWGVTKQGKEARAHRRVAQARQLAPVHVR